MNWKIIFHEEYEPEFDLLSNDVQDEILTKAGFLEYFGHTLGRPLIDTLKGSKFANMKELRVNASDGVWRIAFAFDPKRQAILLVGGDKSGKSEKLFYKQLIDKADNRYENHLKKIGGEG